jgi:hypothetical protein
MENGTSNVSRRGFLAAIGAAGALPLFPALAQQPGPGRWAEAADINVAALRAAYHAEIARLSATLRPRFESGELRAYRDGDDEGVFRGTGAADSPHWEVERICAKHFGLEVKRDVLDNGDEVFQGDGGAAYLVLAASPRAECTEDAFYHACHHAQTAAAWDVIMYARSARWYTPAANETEDPMIGDCPHCGHGLFAHGDGNHELPGCQVHDCECRVRHTPHVAGFMA